MWKELQQVIDSQLPQTVVAIAKKMKILPTENEKPIPIPKELSQQFTEKISNIHEWFTLMDEVIDMMIKEEKNPSKQKEAFVKLHKLNTEFGGFGDDIIAKTAKKRSEALIKKHPILKPIRPLLEEYITFFYHRKLASMRPKAEKLYNHRKLASMRPKAEKLYNLFQEEDKLAESLVDNVFEQAVAACDGRKTADGVTAADSVAACNGRTAADGVAACDGRTAALARLGIFTVVVATATLALKSRSR